MSDQVKTESKPPFGKPSMEGVLGDDPKIAGLGGKPASKTVIPINQGYFEMPEGSADVVSPVRDRIAEKE